MTKIKIEDGKFECPMLGLTLTERGELNFGTCRICKNNVLGQAVQDYIYCNFGSSSGGNNSGGQNENQDPWEDYNNGNNNENSNNNDNPNDYEVLNGDENG